jgi:arylsulfatase
VTFNGWGAKPWPLKPDLHPVVWIFDQARKALKETPVDQPLFLTASFFAPHPPLCPPPQYFEMYSKQKLPAPAHGDWVNWAALSPKGNEQGDRVLLEAEPLQAAQSGYFGLITLLDDQTAQLVADFKARSRQAGHPWVILFTTDHGEMLGDHGYFRKCEPYEGSANIPFIFAGSPELGFKAGITSSQPVCLEDILPTLLELAGVRIPDPMDGVNLLPTLRGQKQTIRQILHFEHAVCYNKPQAFQALTDGRFKYIWRPLDGSEQLFDLLQDPQEEHDLARQDSQQKKLEQWRQRMIKVLAGRPEGFTDGKKLISGRPYPPLQARSQRADAQ